MDLLQVSLLQQTPIPLNAQLHCNSGKVLALVGPSGSGKSTILRCIAGLFRPTSGLIRFNEAVWYSDERKLNIPAQLRRCGYVFQDFALMPHLNVFDNICIALVGLSRTERKRRVHSLLARVSLSGLETRKPSQLSGGQQQRVALARALAMDPSVLLLDEPFSSVDQVTRRKLRRELLELKKDLRIPVILVTHDLDEAFMLGDDLCVLQSGHTLQHGSLEDVTQRPKSSEVAKLLDIRNIFKARVVEHKKETQTTTVQWKNQLIEAPLSTMLQPGETIFFCIPTDKVLLHRRVKPSRGVAENPLQAKVRGMITVTGFVSVLLDCANGELVEMDLPLHVVTRNQVKVGDQISVSLLSSSIHLMRS